jgi:hypothetical protein
LGDDGLAGGGLAISYKVLVQGDLASRWVLLGVLVEEGVGMGRGDCLRMVWLGTAR